MATIQTTLGPIEVEDTGGDGPTLFFVHGFMVDGRLWSKVVPLLRDDFRCVVPNLPLGSHKTPAPPEAELTPRTVAHLLDELMAKMNLDDVTVVANDTGGAITQILVTEKPERVGAMVLTNCDAFENFLPPAFRPMQWIAHVPGGVGLIAQSMRFDALRKLPNAFGRLAKHGYDDATLQDWVRPVRENKGIRRDVGKLLRGITTKDTLAAAEKLKHFDRPTLITWAHEDRFFKVGFAERLAAAIPNCRLERIPDAWTFVMLDQPERLAELITSFALPAPNGSEASADRATA